MFYFWRILEVLDSNRIKEVEMLFIEDLERRKLFGVNFIGKIEK